MTANNKMQSNLNLIFYLCRMDDKIKVQNLKSIITDKRSNFQCSPEQNLAIMIIKLNVKFTFTFKLADNMQPKLEDIRYF